ncbi:hypothetical protein SAMN04487881_0018 [Marinobacter sp. es.048]|uniref:hypothetical protein n=1 Tax=Marinobacter sp. es.048 TaxID=1761795 RepID=UPI000B59266B|nr:hypothetical protein [Marinobacter sp. es.048]SNC59245.1 hypothetical protein SAMN04487881_0018 [Marinobacter sp. es.048]
MVVYVFVMFILHKLYIFPLIVDLTRWASYTLADLGMEHAAYWAALGWMPGNSVFWLTWFLECLILLAIVPGLLGMLNKADALADR